MNFFVVIGVILCNRANINNRPIGANDDARIFADIFVYSYTAQLIERLLKTENI